MKKIFYTLISFIFFIGCADLDLQPTDMISEDAVKKDPQLVEAFNKDLCWSSFEPNEGVGFPNQID